MAEDYRPLAGIRVLDFTRVMAGPFCTALMADLGAEVIKVEPPAGDDYRHIGPSKEGESALFTLANRGKKSIVLDLKTAKGLELAQALAAKSDVVVENFRPGVARKLGIDCETLQAANPRLIYASISGFGQSGPFAERPAYDIIVQAMSGLMEATGEPDGPPTLVGEAIGDLSAGLFASWAVMAALFGRERTGKGQYIDVAMYDALFALLPTSIAQLFVTGKTPTRSGNRHPFSAPFGTYKSRDGHVVIAVLNDRLFQQLCAVIGREDLLQDARYGSDHERSANEPSLRAALEGWTTERDSAELLAILAEHGIPAAPIWNIQQAVSSEHVRQRQLVTDVEHPKLGTIQVMEQPVHFRGRARGKLAPPPGLGQHSESVLRDVLGLASDEIDALRAAKAI
ncbi:MAG: CaiB/BaiF CoA transferase family protein [Alphaproteobacteria bacterium]